MDEFGQIVVAERNEQQTIVTKVERVKNGLMEASPSWNMVW